MARWLIQGEARVIEAATLAEAVHAYRAQLGDGAIGVVFGAHCDLIARCRAEIKDHSQWPETLLWAENLLSEFGGIRYE